MRQSLELLKQEILSTVMAEIPERCGAFIPPEDVISEIIELADLESQLEYLRGDPPNSESSGAFVRAPIKPPPHNRSGAIALPEPEEPIL
jgi:hypothetical protein